MTARVAAAVTALKRKDHRELDNLNDEQTVDALSFLRANHEAAFNDVVGHWRQSGWSGVESLLSKLDAACDPDDMRSRSRQQIGLIGQRDPASIPRTPWLVEGLLLRRDITLLAGAGGTGKSLLVWQICVSVATGTAFAGWTPDKPRKVLVLSGEDDFDEIERRVAVACKAMGVDRAALGDSFRVVLSRNIRIASKGKDGTAEQTPLWDMVRWTIQNDGIELLVVDPLMKVSAGMDESSSDDQDTLFEKLRALTEGTDCAILIADHTSKGGIGGDQSAVRGSSAKVDASRITMTLTRMTVDEHDKTLKPPRNREAYVHLECPKQNYAKAGGSQWFEIREYDVGNDEPRPALVPWEPHPDIDILSAGGFKARGVTTDLIAEGRSEAKQAGWPWCATFKGQKSTRLDAALSERLGCTIEVAQDWIDAFEIEGVIERRRWRSPSDNLSKVWALAGNTEPPKHGDFVGGESS
jgi:hypothetical protein